MTSQSGSPVDGIEKLRDRISALEKTVSKLVEASALSRLETNQLIEHAKRVVVDFDRASASLLQRRLYIGYARARRLLDILSEQGVLEKTDSHGRAVLIQPQDLAPKTQK